MIRKKEKIRTREDEDYIFNDEYGVWWSRCEGIGPVTANKLLDEFITARNVYDTSIDEIVCCLGISEKHAYGWRARL